MKFSTIATALVAFASSALATAAPAETLSSIVDALAARSEGAEYFHVASDHVLRAITADFRVVGRQPLESRHAAEFASHLDEDMVERAVSIDERELLTSIANQRRYAERRAASVVPKALVDRQSCPSNPQCYPGCGSCRCAMSGLTARCSRV